MDAKERINYIIVNFNRLVASVGSHHVQPLRPIESQEIYQRFNINARRPDHPYIVQDSHEINEIYTPKEVNRGHKSPILFPDLRKPHLPPDILKSKLNIRQSVRTVEQAEIEQQDLKRQKIPKVLSKIPIVPKIDQHDNDMKAQRLRMIEMQQQLKKQKDEIAQLQHEKQALMKPLRVFRHK